MGYTGDDGDERLQLVSFHSTSKVSNELVLEFAFPLCMWEEELYVVTASVVVPSTQDNRAG